MKLFSSVEENALYPQVSIKTLCVKHENYHKI